MHFQDETPTIRTSKFQVDSEKQMAKRTVHYFDNFYMSKETSKKEKPMNVHLMERLLS